MGASCSLYSIFHLCEVDLGGQGCPPHKSFIIYVCTLFTCNMLYLPISSLLTVHCSLFTDYCKPQRYKD